MIQYSAVIVAGGQGTRFHGPVDKLWYPLRNGIPVILQTLNTFMDDPDCQEIVLVASRQLIEEYRKRTSFKGKIVITWGGATRQESVYNGLMACGGKYVLIHDGARPWIDHSDIDAVKEALPQKKAVILSHKVTDTIKVVDEEKITGTIDRNKLRAAETPQAFEWETILSCYEKAMREGIQTTDDAQLYQQITGEPVYCIDSTHYNGKVTTIEDVVGR